MSLEFCLLTEKVDLFWPIEHYFQMQCLLVPKWDLHASDHLTGLLHGLQLQLQLNEDLRQQLSQIRFGYLNNFAFSLVRNILDKSTLHLILTKMGIG